MSNPPKTAVPDDASDLWRAIQALVRRFSVSERAEVSCCGVTVAQAAALEALQTGPLRIGDLARRLGISPSTATRNLQRLEQIGLVERFSDRDDARAARVRLTEAGKRAAGELAQQNVVFACSIVDEIPPARRKAVSAALDEILTAVRHATETCCPGAFEHLLAQPPETTCCEDTPGKDTPCDAGCKDKDTGCKERSKP